MGSRFYPSEYFPRAKAQRGEHCRAIEARLKLLRLDRDVEGQFCEVWAWENDSALEWYCQGKKKEAGRTARFQKRGHRFKGERSLVIAIVSPNSFELSGPPSAWSNRCSPTPSLHTSPLLPLLVLDQIVVEVRSRCESRPRRTRVVRHTISEDYVAPRRCRSVPARYRSGRP